MNNGQFPQMKMRGSPLFLLIGMIAGMGALVWSGSKETPEIKASRKCMDVALEHYTGERPQGHIPYAAAQNAYSKCVTEFRARAASGE